MQRALGLYAQNDIEISGYLTPGLDRCLRSVYERLQIPITVAQAFVYSSPTIQAGCLTTTETECVVRFSSGLVDLLDDQEITFVAGHEVGHFLLGHQRSMHSTETDSVEYYMQSRYQEISADRIGLIACGSLEKAVRALMKTSSGLSDRHLRFDVSAFLDQLRLVRSGDGGTGSTHPSVIMRARALLWFSMSNAYKEGWNSNSQGDLDTLDSRVAADLDRYVDGSVRRVIEEARHSLLLWTVADHVVGGGAFRREQQIVAKQLLGEESVEGLRRFMGSLDTGTATAEVRSRLTVAGDELRRLIPGGFEAEFAQIGRDVATLMGEDGV
jgi:hypothetical protein